jgi:hypothetical protein
VTAFPDDAVTRAATMVANLRRDHPEQFDAEGRYRPAPSELPALDELGRCPECRERSGVDVVVLPSDRSMANRCGRTCADYFFAALCARCVKRAAPGFNENRYHLRFSPTDWRCRSCRTTNINRTKTAKAALEDSRCQRCDRRPAEARRQHRPGRRIQCRACQDGRTR